MLEGEECGTEEEAAVVAGAATVREGGKELGVVGTIPCRRSCERREQMVDGASRELGAEVGKVSKQGGEHTGRGGIRGCSEAAALKEGGQEQREGRSFPL
eukprot:3383676-Rhodomonas_salina.1